MSARQLVMYTVLKSLQLKKMIIELELFIPKFEYLTVSAIAISDYFRGVARFFSERAYS